MRSDLLRQHSSSLLQELPCGSRVSLPLGTKVILWLMFFACFYYNILDVWHTQLLLATGLCEEANPWMKWVIDRWGITSIYFVKTGMFILLGIPLHLYTKGGHAKG